ncbi:MAG TPA: hypothetical protein EYH01_03665 [Campylobacterales bacterium]|nr:hypothetical protein [Campylobacterales bacterium]HIP59508.1 hypothetical protein [Campylobacterales bacterium]
MIKAITYKCIILSIFSFAPSVFAGDYKTLKIKTLNAVPNVKKSRSSKKEFLEKINAYIGEDIDLSIFDKKKDGLSVYAKISRVSRLGVRYRF